MYAFAETFDRVYVLQSLKFKEQQAEKKWKKNRKIAEFQKQRAVFQELPFFKPQLQVSTSALNTFSTLYWLLNSSFSPGDSPLLDILPHLVLPCYAAFFKPNITAKRWMDLIERFARILGCFFCSLQCFIVLKWSDMKRSVTRQRLLSQAWFCKVWHAVRGSRV